MTILLHVMSLCKSRFTGKCLKESSDWRNAVNSPVVVVVLVVGVVFKGEHMVNVVNVCNKNENDRFCWPLDILDWHVVCESSSLRGDKFLNCPSLVGWPGCLPGVLLWLR